MRILFLSMILSLSIYGQGARISVSSLPTAFDATDTQSCAITCRSGSELVVMNETTDRLAVGICYGCSSTPTEDFAYIPGGTDAGRVFKPTGGKPYVMPSNSLVCVRVTDGSAATSGSVEIDCR